MIILDISVPVDERIPVWPGDPKVEMSRFLSLDGGDPVNATRLCFSVHSGTHVDSPRHCIANGSATEELDLRTLIGPAYVAEFTGVDRIGAAELEAAAIPPDTARLLLKTDNSLLWEDPHHEFRRDFAALTTDGAHWIVERGIRLVGIDYHSIQRFDDDNLYTHRTLLEAPVIIVEALDLRAAAAGTYLLSCLPLKLVGCDGAPARAVLISDAFGQEVGQ